MNDQELLEFAARAFDDEGIHISGDQYVRFLGEHEDQTPCFTVWNPLLNDADAFQLMVKLNLAVEVCNENSKVFFGDFGEFKRSTYSNSTDKESATRRAIVMAAAEIGKGM